MKFRLTIIFALIVLLPLAVLGWLGIRVARNERLMVEQQFNALVLDRLRDVDTSISSLLEQRERDLLALPALSSLTPEALRRLARESATVRHFFVMNERNELRYPLSLELAEAYVAASSRRNDLSDPPQPQDLPEAIPGEAMPLMPLSSEETAFLARTHEIWTEKRIPTENSEERGAPYDQPEGKGPLGAASSLPAKGWYAWHWGDGIHFIFWWRDSAGLVVGAELSPVRLASDIIGMLPDTHPERTTLPDGSIVLRDTKGSALYRWGAYESAESALPLVSLSLRAPLSTWRLEYHAAPDFTGGTLGRGVIFNLLSALTVLGLTIMALAVYYYRESAREMREAKQRVSFVNQVSHELKTPLTSIRMYAEMLEEEVDDAEEKARRHARIIVAESQRLSRLIGNVLTFGKKQRCALKLHITPGNPDEVIRGVIERFGPTFDSKGFSIAFDAGAPDEAHFDRDAVEQIIGNLLGNVEKYALAGRHARIVSRREKDVVTITVSDNGPGIPPREGKRIFLPFYRVSNKITDGIAGAGIGLAIARDLARLHGGELTLEPSDKGACFKVVLHAPLKDTEGLPS